MKKSVVAVIIIVLVLIGVWAYFSIFRKHIAPEIKVEPTCTTLEGFNSYPWSGFDNDSIRINIEERDDKKLTLCPPGVLKIKRGSDDEKAFSFILRNLNREPTDFTYIVEVEPEYNVTAKCSRTLNKEIVNGWIINPAGSISLEPGQKSENPEIILLDIPNDAPLCILPLRITVKLKSGTTYDTQMMVFKITD